MNRKCQEEPKSTCPRCEPFSWTQYAKLLIMRAHSPRVIGWIYQNVNNFRTIIWKEKENKINKEDLSGRCFCFNNFALHIQQFLQLNNEHLKLVLSRSSWNFWFMFETKWLQILKFYPFLPCRLGSLINAQSFYFKNCETTRTLVARSTIKRNQWEITHKYTLTDFS